MQLQIGVNSNNLLECNVFDLLRKIIESGPYPIVGARERERERGRVFRHGGARGVPMIRMCHVHYLPPGGVFVNLVKVVNCICLWAKIQLLIVFIFPLFAHN